MTKKNKKLAEILKKADSGGEYPKNLFSNRRIHFIAQIWHFIMRMLTGKKNK